MATLPSNTPLPAKGYFSREAMGGVPWTIVNNAVLSVVYFGTSIFMVDYMSEEDWGVFSLCRGIGEFLALVCLLGLNISLLRFIPELRVNTDKAGLLRLIRKSALLQGLATVAVGVGLYIATPMLSERFGVELGYLTLFIGLFVASRVMKQFVDDVLTALYRVPVMSILSILQGVIRFALVAVILYFIPTVTMALGIQVVSVIPLALVGWWIIQREITGYNWKSPERSIGKRRVLLLSGPRYFNSLLVKLMGKYTEQWFLGAYFGAAIVGVHELAFTIPMMVITTLPMAVQKLYYSAFAEAYARDPGTIKYLLSAFYKMLIVMVLPISVFGAFFTPALYPMVYGQEPAAIAAGQYAPYYVVFHTLAMVSLPIGAALVTYEKLYLTTPMMIIQLGINVLFDYLLVPRYEMMGAIAAIYLTFGVTIPIRLLLARYFIGGLGFPTWFAMKHVIALTALAGCGYLLAPNPTVVTLILIALAYGALYLLLIRFARLIRPDDVAELRALKFRKFNLVLDYLVPEKAAS